MNRYNFTTLLLSIAVLFLLSSCCHKDSNPCPALGKEYVEFLHHEIGSEFSYINGSGQEIKFKVNTKEISGPYDANCGTSEVGFCNCSDCDKENGSYMANSNDSLWIRYDSANQTMVNWGKIGYLIDEKWDIRDDQAHLTLLFTFRSYDFLYPIDTIRISRQGNRTLIHSLTLGAHTYTDVIQVKIDTSSTYNNGSFFTEFYFQPKNGLIGFHDIQTNSLFYLK